MALNELTSGDFEKELNDGVCLIDFYADWCGPCRALAPVMERVEELGVSVYKIDIEANSDAAARFGVRSIPTVIVMKNKKPVEILVGTKSFEDYESVINKINEE